jgi:hypothetical protein
MDIFAIPSCDAYGENAWHLFVTCSIAIETWKALGLWDVIESHVMTADGMFDLFFTVSNQLSQVKRSMWCTTMWSLWKSRNLKLWDEIDEVITTIYQRAAMFLNQWQWANLKQSTSAASSSLPPAAKWLKPPFGKVKCNIDAAFLDGKVGIGICLRDHDGRFIKAKTLCIAAYLTIKEGEAFGLLASN